MLDTGHQPKMDDFERYLFLVLKLFYLTGEAASLENEQISLVARPGLVISLEERPTDIFNPVRERLRKGKGRIRSRGSDYLTHALIDAVVDSYDSIFDRVGERIDRLQDELLAAPKPATLQAILQLKRELLQLRKSIWPTREFVNALSREPSALIGSEVTLFLRDVYDHAVRAIDLLENDREMLSGMVDLYLSSSSQRLNEIMKVLTVIATLFIPLTFLAGVYGMNFRYMPELEWRWGYPLFWVLILVTGGGMLAWLRHRRWL
jgi:magnesium transporter